MFWTKNDSPPSLAKRLSLWYASSAFLLILITTGLLYFGLTQRFDQQNDQYLREKLSSLRTLVHGPRQNLSTVRWEVEEERETISAIRVMSRVLSSDERIQFETNGMSKELPTELLDSLGQQEGTGRDVRSTTGKHFRVLTGKFKANPPSVPSGFEIQVAIDLTYQQQLLESYRNRVWLVLGIGLLAAVLIGHRIARAGMAPLEQMANIVRRVRSTTLNERLPLGGLPREVYELAETLNETLDRLEDAFERLSRFSSDLAHELRSPIGNIRGELEITLARARTPLEYREVIGSSLEECQKLSRLIDRLLFLARAERPETQIRRERVDLQRELKTFLEFYEPAATERGIQMSLEVAAPIAADADRTLFQVAISNLLENAIHHTAEGGSIALRACVKDSVLSISVSDTGIGIPPDQLQRVFERFYRVDPAREHKNGGAGLGLALVQTVARLHSGRTEIQSELGRGTCVTIHFPCSQPEPEITKT
jgi:two-component system, OmpR family, heavy metal sensor histidine kinase CusS